MLDASHDHALRRRILEAVDAELDRQEELHGDRSIRRLGPDDRFLALSALVEEVGELARALIATSEDGDEVGAAILEAVQVAASAAALTHNLAAPGEEIRPGLFAALFNLPRSRVSKPLGLDTSVFLDDEVDGAVWTERAKRMAARLAGDDRRGAGMYRDAVRNLLARIGPLPLPPEEAILNRGAALMAIGLVALEVAVQEEILG